MAARRIGHKKTPMDFDAKDKTVYCALHSRQSDSIGDLENYTTESFSEDSALEDHPEAQVEEKIINAVHSQIKPCWSRSVSIIDSDSLLKAIRTEIRQAVGSMKEEIEETLEKSPEKLKIADDAWKLCFIYDELLKVVSDMRKECATQLEQQSKLVQKLQLKLEKEEEHCSDLTKLIEKLLNSSLVLPETNSGHAGRLLTSRYLDDTARKYLDESVSSFESHLTENRTRTLERHFCNENIVSTSRPRAVGSCQSLYPRESCPNVPVQVFNSGDLSQEHSLCSDDDILAAIQLGHSESSMIQPVDSNEITLPWLLWETELDVPSSTTMQVQKDFQRFCRSNNNNTCIEIAALPGLCDSDKETDSIKGEDASVLKTRNDTNGIQNPKLGSNSIQTKVFQEQDRAYLTAEDFLMDRARYKTSVESGCLILCMGKLW